MKISPPVRWVLGAWLLLVGSYALVSLVVPRGFGLTTFGNVMQCIVPLFANVGLLLNAASPNRRRNTFWMLLALGCTLWMAGQLWWTYVEIGLGQEVPNPFGGDAVFFLHTVPMIGALAMQPHLRQPDRASRVGTLDLLLLLLWWAYLYLFIVVPWQYISPDVGAYGHNFNVLYTVENVLFLVGMGWLCLRSQGGWRMVYAHLFGATFLYTFGSQTINVMIDAGRYYTGSPFDVPLVASFVWFGTAGILAHSRAGELEPGIEPGSERDLLLPARVAVAAVFSLPLLGMWSYFISQAPDEVTEFRLLITMLAIILLTALVFLRQQLVDQERLRLLRASQESIERLQRLQLQLVQSEKLASLGQLAAGAAHEINNPLTAILGYADLLVEDPVMDEKPRTMAQKIREQARRTQALVKNLLSFARQVPAEKTLLDINPVVSNAVGLRTLELRAKKIRIALETESVLPAVRGDANQLLQVFYNIIQNAVDAMEEVGGGLLRVVTKREGASVVIELSDTGPGVGQPQRVFDPFYTTKPVGKGTGLGLSICYGIVQEHNGTISCHNRPEGGATFRIELPAILAVFPHVPAPEVEAHHKGAASHESSTARSVERRDE